MTIQFLTNVVKPWDELNALLAQRLAFQPEISDVTRLAGTLAVAIKHQPEAAKVDPKLVLGESPENRIMSDVGDAWKHGTLTDPARRNRITVGAQFECNSENKYRFLRNVLTVHHASQGDLDFMETSGAAIAYWIGRLKLGVNWQPQLAEGPAEFHDEAFLFFDPKYQIRMSATNLRVVRRTADGALVPYDPPEIRFAVYKHPAKAT